MSDHSDAEMNTFTAPKRAASKSDKKAKKPKPNSVSAKSNAPEPADNNDFSDLLDELAAAPVTGGELGMATNPSGDSEAALQVPDGRVVAFQPGKGNEVQGTVLNACPKYDATGMPTSLKVVVAISNIKAAGKDVVTAGCDAGEGVTGFVLVQEGKVKTDAGVDVQVPLITTDITPTAQLTTKIVSTTVTLNKIQHKGLREAAVQKVAPGATISLSRLGLKTLERSGNTYMGCDGHTIKTMASADEPQRGAADAISTLRRDHGLSMLMGAVPNCGAFKADQPTDPASKVFYDRTLKLWDASKQSFAAKMGALAPNTFVSPTGKLEIVEGDLQVPPLALLHMTKMELAPGRAMLLNDTKLYLAHSKKGSLESLLPVFNNQPIASTAVTGCLTADIKFSGPIYNVATTVSIIHPGIPVTSIASILTVPGPTYKMPKCFLGAAFGVTDGTTTDLLSLHVLPYANAAMMPSKARIYRRKYDESDYIQDAWLDSSAQLLVDTLGTMRNVGLRLSSKYVKDIFGNGRSTPVSTAGDNLIDAYNGESKVPPVVATLSNAGGIASLRETAVDLNDATLEFYAIVPDAIKIVQSAGNTECGTNTIKGEETFDKWLEEQKDEPTAKQLLATGNIGIFAIRVKTKTSANTSANDATDTNAAESESTEP